MKCKVLGVVVERLQFITHSLSLISEKTFFCPMGIFELGVGLPLKSIQKYEFETQNDDDDDVVDVTQRVSFSRSYGVMLRIVN